MTAPFVMIEEVKTTLPSLGAAEELATALVEQRLAACVQIGPISSIYRWQGFVKKDQEFSLSCKTTVSRLSHLIAYVQSHHPYELPEVVVGNLRASPEYAQWLNEQVDVCSH